MKMSPIRIDLAMDCVELEEESHVTYETRDTLSDYAHKEATFRETNVVADYIKEFCEARRMSKRDMGILSMRLHEYTHQEIGELCGVSRGTVDKVLSEFKCKFARWLLKNHHGQWIVQQWY